MAEQVVLSGGEGSQVEERRELGQLSEWPPFPVYPGVLNLLVGHPGVGKSFLALDLAARASVGAPPPPHFGGAPKRRERQSWEGEEEGDLFSVPGSVVVMSAENNHVHLHMRAFGVGHYYSPALGHSALQPKRCYYSKTEETVTISPFMRWLKEEIDPKKLRMVVLDPLPAFAGPIGASASSILKQLMPLIDYAFEMRFAIVGVLHVTKRLGLADPVHMALGSLGYTSVARSVMMVTRDDRPGREGSESRLVLPIKNNCAKVDVGYVFKMRSREALTAPALPPEHGVNADNPRHVPTPEEHLEYQRVEELQSKYRREKDEYDEYKRYHLAPPPEVLWERELVMEHPLLRNGHGAGRESPAELALRLAAERAAELAAIEKTKLDLAEEFLVETLREGPMASVEVMKLARAVPLSERTLERARGRVGVRVVRRGRVWVQEMGKGGR